MAHLSERRKFFSDVRELLPQDTVERLESLKHGNLDAQCIKKQVYVVPVSAFAQAQEDQERKDLKRGTSGNAIQLWWTGQCAVSDIGKLRQHFDQFQVVIGPAQIGLCGSFQVLLELCSGQQSFQRETIEFIGDI